MVIPAKVDRAHNALGSSVCRVFWLPPAGEFMVPSETAYDPGTHLVWLSIKQSKTDPFRQGVDIFLGRSGTSICPVQALIQYISIRPPVPGRLFLLSSGTPLTWAYLVSNVQAALRQVGLDDSACNRHSFRISFYGLSNAFI